MPSFLPTYIYRVADQEKYIQMGLKQSTELQVATHEKYLKIWYIFKI
jgi:hypothetical protein